MARDSRTGPRAVGVAELAGDAGVLAIDEVGRPVEPLVLVDLDGVDWSAVSPVVERLSGRPAPVLVGLASAPLPLEAAPLLERLVCTLAPGGPGASWVVPGGDDLKRIAATVAATPYASTTLAGLLEVTAQLPVAAGLVAESLAYSMLLAGEEFAAWRAARPRRGRRAVTDPVRLVRDGATLVITLDQPARHNAFGRATRDGMIEGLALAEADPTIERVVVQAEGPSFCSGGDLDEFGTAPDPVTAHLVRLARSAGAAVHRLADRTTVLVHGACIGAGVEIPAFAGRIEARADAFFQLPELSMGLVPGAGGTVSITRRIGRWRTAYLALSGRRIDAATALEWGLVDAVG